tara:strand:+ start:2228 stop:3436 length:1209 start_codon:yes stop_codon:yes gene_type:complete
VARRPNTGGITQIGEFMVNNSLPIAPRFPTPKPLTRVRSGGNEGYIIGPTDMVYKYSDLPKLKEQVAQNPMMARMLGDIISRLEAKDFDGTGDPLGNRQMERPPVKQPLIRPPSIEEEIEQVISGPSFPGRQTPKARDLPVRIPEPVGPITDTRTMPSMPVAPVPSPMSVPPIAIEDPDIQKVVDALPKGTQQPVQPPVIEDMERDDYGLDFYKNQPVGEGLKTTLPLDVDPTLLTVSPPGPINPPQREVDAEGNPFVLRHSEQDPITGEVLNNQPFGGEIPPFAVDPIPDPITGDRYPPVSEGVELGAETTSVQGMTMEQMQQMIADMQAQQQEQAAERAAQEKEMAQNYMVPGSRMGYNPYLSGQYQSDPYGPSGVPNMGGITTIPVPGGYGIYNPIYGG